MVRTGLKNVSVVVFAVVLVCLCLMVGTGQAATGQPGTIKVGALYPYSGALALLGDESSRGLELAVEEINAAGGIQGGKKIELVKADGVDPNQAVGEARRLISVVGVQAIFGTLCINHCICRQPGS